MALSVNYLTSYKYRTYNWGIDAAGPSLRKPSSEQDIIQCTHVSDPERDSLGQVCSACAGFDGLEPGSCSRLQPK